VTCFPIREESEITEDERREDREAAERYLEAAEDMLEFDRMTGEFPAGPGLSEETRKDMIERFVRMRLDRRCGRSEWISAFGPPE